MSRTLTDEELEAKALEFRRKLGLEHQSRIDLMTVISKLKATRSGFDYQRVPDHEMTDAEGQWDSEKQTMRLRESVFAGMQAQHSRAKMTVSHELAHHVLGHTGLRNRSLTKSAAERFLYVVKKEEHEARRLGAMILAPGYLIRPEDTAEDISSRFGISMEAAAYRHQEVADVVRRAAGIRRELPSKVVDFLREAKRRGHTVLTDIGDD